MKILIIEDDDILYRVLQEKFEEKNFEVQVVKDGEKAVMVAKKFKPDIIILDILMPKAGGIEILAQLKASSELAHIPVIALSNVDEDKTIKQVLVLGAVDYLIKTEHPINEVVEKINKYILRS